MPRRTLSLLTLIAVLGALLAACGSAPSAPASGQGTTAPAGATAAPAGATAAPAAASGEPVTLRLMIGAIGNNKPWEDLVAGFQAAHPNITVKLDVVPQDQGDTMLATQLNSGNAPDLFLTTSGAAESSGTPRLAQAGLLLDLSDQPWASRVDKALWGSMGTDGKLYKLPIQYVAIAAMYNPAVFEEHGLSVPTTWSEMLAFCDTANAAGITPIALGAQVPFASGPVISALAASTVYAKTPDFNAQQQSGAATFANSGWKDTLNKFAELNERGCFNEGAVGTPIPAAQDLFTSGKAATYIFYTGLAAGLKAAQNIDLAAFPVPGDTAADTRVVAMPGIGLSIYAKTKAPDAARAFLEYVASDEASSKFAAAMDWSPVLEGVSYEPSPVHAPVFEAIQAGKVIPIPEVSWPNPDVQQTMWRKAQELLGGQTTVDEMLAAMDEAYAK